MRIISIVLLWLVFTAPCSVLLFQSPASAQTGDDRPPVRRVVPPLKPMEALAREKLNTWTVGLAGGQLEGAPIRFATEIARVVDDGDNLHVLPIVTRGPAENVEALLYLKGVDLAIVNTDALEQFRTLVPDIQQRITYILNLFPSEVHIFVRPEIKSLADLTDRKVNFNTPGTAAAYSGPLIFDRRNIQVEKTFIPHQTALEQMKAGQGNMAAAVFITSKPVDAFTRGQWPAGFKFLPLPFDGQGLYLPATLTSADYPQFIAAGEGVQTIAVPTVLAAYNWQKGSDRYKRVARLAEYLFSRLDRLQAPGFHPKWKEVTPTASVPGLNRFPAAQEWLGKAAAQVNKEETLPGAVRSNAPPAVDQQLFQEFMNWRRLNNR